MVSWFWYDVTVRFMTKFFTERFSWSHRVQLFHCFPKTWQILKCLDSYEISSKLLKQKQAWEHTFLCVCVQNQSTSVCSIYYFLMHCNFEFLIKVRRNLLEIYIVIYIIYLYLLIWITKPFQNSIFSVPGF